MEPKYVIQRTDNSNDQVAYLSPGRVNWITQENHKKYGTRYGKWIWDEAATMSAKLNAEEDRNQPRYSFVALS